MAATVSETLYEIITIKNRIKVFYLTRNVKENSVIQHFHSCSLVCVCTCVRVIACVCVCACMPTHRRAVTPSGTSPLAGRRVCARCLQGKWDETASG